MMFYNILMVILCVVLAGTFAGLTLAMFSIPLSSLEQKIRLGDKQAKKVYILRKKGNRLLCSLLLGNVASYTILAIFLGSITNGVLAGFIATSLIFIFGEILPQAIFPRYALEIAYRLSWLIWFVLYIFYPVAAPVAWVLDKVLGEEPPQLWSKEELGEIIKYHEDVGDGIIDKDEERIVLGALSFSELCVVDIMIPREHVFYLEEDMKVTRKLLNKTKKKGHGRVPVFSNRTEKITGILYLKNLIGIKEKDNIKIGQLQNREALITINEDMNLDHLLNLMIKRKSYFSIAINKHGKFTGIVTMEDIMEEILKTELEEIKE